MRGLKLLLAEPVDVVLCDLEMPGLDGDKLLLRALGAPRRGRTCRSCSSPRRRTWGGARGCSRTAPATRSRSRSIPIDLIARLRLHLKVKRLQDELLVKNATLARLSTVDELTGLRSRRYVSEVLSIEFQRARRYGTPLSLVMADLDHFKRVNDRYGHPGGDAVLQGVARAAAALAARDGRRRSLRRRGAAAWCCRRSMPTGAMIMAERWRASVEHTDFQASDGRPIHAELSIGVAEYTTDLPNADALIVAADKALYTAKQNGRNRVELFRPSAARQP